MIGATKQTYLLTSSDIGDTVVSVLTARNIYGRAAKSAPTASVSSSGGGGGQTGVSKATCSTSPCKSGTIPNGSGQNGCTAGTHATNIVGRGKIQRLGQRMPSVRVLQAGQHLRHGSRRVDRIRGQWPMRKKRRQSGVQGLPLAIRRRRQRLVLVFLAKPGYPTCRGGWLPPNIDPEQPGSDEPYLKSVLDDAISRLGLDSQRI